MPENDVWMSKEFCRTYAEEQDKITMVKSNDREKMLKCLSSYRPSEDKVHVGLGIGGGLDFLLTKNMPNVGRRIGIDYSSHMLEECKERYPETELLEDNFFDLKKLKKVLKKEYRPVFFTFLTNTFGNFAPEDRIKIADNIRSVMKRDDLLVLELYKRPELVSIDPGLPPERHLKTKIRIVDLEKRKLSEPMPLLKVPPWSCYMKNPESAWVLHSMAQQEHYGDFKSIQMAMGKAGHSAYWTDTGNIVIYRLRKDSIRDGVKFRDITEKSRREEFEKYFEPIITSHRWEGLEMISTFSNAGFNGTFINGENVFIPFYMPYDKNKESFRDFFKHYYAQFV